MIRDITIGQYYPAQSPVHRLDPRVKLVATFLFLISLFVFQSFIGYIIVVAALVIVIKSSKVPLGYILRGLKPILFLLLVTAIFNVLWTPGIPMFEWKFISISYRGLRNGAFMVLRLVFLILGSSMLTFTTTPNQLTDAIESILSPLKKLKVPVHDFAMMMSLALRFIPILLEETNRLIKAQNARGADFDEGNILKKLKSMISVLVPLLVSATKRAYELAMAMEARCYRGGNLRTKMKPLKYHRRDRTAYILMAVYMIIIILTNHFF